MGMRKHPRPHKALVHKTNHQTGYHKKQRNPTTNYAKDTHKQFCKRCMVYNGFCPDTGTLRKSFACNL